MTAKKVTKKLEEKKESAKKSKTNFLKKNIWAISTVVLAVLLLLVVVIKDGNSCTTGAVINSQDAGQKIVELMEMQGAEAKIISIDDQGSIYEVIISSGGREGPLYITKDGKNLVEPAPIEQIKQQILSSQAAQEEVQEIPKSEKPSSELFIWSYCPYGVTALAPFAEVAELLGDSADFKVNLYYAGHGDFEVQQNAIQACIQELGYKNEYWKYAKGFVTNIYEKCYGDAACDLEESEKLMNSVGIDSEAVLSCVEENGNTLYQRDYNRAGEMEVTGSPTLMVNEVKANVARTAESYKTVVCSSYENSPEDCSEILSSSAASTTGSC